MILAIRANIGNKYYYTHASVGFSAALQKGLLDKIQPYSFTEGVLFGTASMVTWLTNGVNIVREVKRMSLRLL